MTFHYGQARVCFSVYDPQQQCSEIWIPKADNTLSEIQNEKERVLR